MTTTLVLGLQWGDEGKGKVVDLLAEEADVVVRFQGGANSGHTVQIEDRKFFLHCIPSGILRPEALCLLGRGMVLDLPSVREEIDDLKSKGVLIDGRLYVSPRAHLVLPHQKLLDVAREKSAGDGKIGTTGRGIGPCYSDKASRTGLQLGEIFDPVHLRCRLEQVLPSANAHLKHIYGIVAPSPADVSAELLALADYFRPLTGDVPRMIWDAFDADKRILFEGAQGALLDLDAGSYPFVTSSTTISAGVWSGTGFPSTLIDRTVGVLKAYTTRVGMGPFPTEIQGELAENLRKRGNEFGTTTGRPRRIGWLDLPAMRSMVRLNLINEVFVTKLDILSGLDEIQVCDFYETPDERFYELPEDPMALATMKPTYFAVEGWKEDISNARALSELPQAAQNYLELISECTDVPVTGVSVGPARHQNFFHDGSSARS